MHVCCFNTQNLACIMIHRNIKTLRTSFAHDLFLPHVEYLHQRSLFFFYAVLILAGVASCVYICLKRCNRVEKKRFIEHVRVFKIVPNVHIHFNPNQIQTAIIRCAKSANRARRIYLNDVDIMIIFFH